MAFRAEDLRGQRIAVVGDVMLDHFLFGRVDRISPEAPVPIVRYERDEYRLGGAANVAHNIAALGGGVDLVGLVGQDDAGRRLCETLRSTGIDPGGLIEDPDRPTTRKQRLVTSRNQQVARVDYEADADPSPDVADRVRARLVEAIAASRALVISDYRKGVVTQPLLSAAFDATRKAGIPALVDPKVMQPDWYRGATLITPNHHEASLMTQMPVRTDDEARRAARVLHERTGASILITRGDQGMWILDAASAKPVERALPAAAREVADVTGAGDTVVAVLALGLAAGATLSDAAELANVAAGLVVARFGAVAVTRAELAAASA